ncbi:MAG: hypothetical protein LBH00_11170, partial [Planctomycetaceae bacterium]|nr:hypothetical protein [Planctomycetaceae bacterium]
AAVHVSHSLLWSVQAVEPFPPPLFPLFSAGSQPAKTAARQSKRVAKAYFAVVILRGNLPPPQCV